MRGFKENNNLQIEKNNTALGKQPKRFDLLQQRATMTDASLSAMKQRDETLTSIERIQLHNERSKIDTRRLAQKTRMDDRAWDKWQAGEYGVKGWDEKFIPEGNWTDYGEHGQTEASSRHGQGDQAGSSEGDQTMKYDKDYASMTQEQRGRELVIRMLECYGASERGAAIRRGNDIRSFILNTGIKLDSTGYTSAINTKTYEAKDVNKINGIISNIKRCYTEEGAVNKNVFTFSLD